MVDVEANLLRDKHSMLCNTVSRMVEQLQASSSEEVLQRAASDLVSRLTACLKDVFFSYLEDIVA